MTWLSTAAAAARAQRHPVTVRRAYNDGSLHGHQPLDAAGRPLRGSRVTYHPDAVDAWIQGHDVQAQARACGCPAVRAIRRPA